MKMAYLEYISGSHDTVEGQANRFDERYVFLIALLLMDHLVYPAIERKRGTVNRLKYERDIVKES